MEGFWIAGAICAIKALSYVCDFFTFPVYLVLQRPWEKRKQSRRIKAKVISREENSITYRSVDSPGNMHISLNKRAVETLDEMLLWVTQVHSSKRCLGTRQILAEEDELQPNGRVFKKVKKKKEKKRKNNNHLLNFIPIILQYKMGDYKWKSFSEVEHLAASFGRGLRDLGTKSRQNVVIFAETRAEWMIAAHGCFKQNFPLVTIYATLGDEAIAHGINETEVETVITSHDLLPKFKRLLELAPRVKTIIFMEDQLKPTNTSGYKVRK